MDGTVRGGQSIEMFSIFSRYVNNGRKIICYIAKSFITGDIKYLNSDGWSELIAFHFCASGRASDLLGLHDSESVFWVSIMSLCFSTNTTNRQTHT